MSEQIIGGNKVIEIKAPPEAKMILVIDTTDELNTLLKTGWKIAGEYRHGQGALILMLKDRL